MYPSAVIALIILMLPDVVVERSILLPAIISSVLISVSTPFKITEPFCALAFTESALKTIAFPSLPKSPFCAVKDSFPCAVIDLLAPS